ncbi:sulfotransferase domain-containing protein [Cytophaga aurantiaca]|uniref:sulfotransferase domain-containing protein n=1 Tax=Cytophaga aurantiaca TaxID=29530 RepID=UPI00036E0BC4|nr:sulfotransferase domain-containing protein [Cytophaga aurantiaca]
MNKIKLFGERNTGTNYVAKLITINAADKIEWMRSGVPRRKLFKFSEFTKDLFFFFTARYNLGWKHAEVKMKHVLNHRHLADIHFITISKNPYSFLLSLYKRPYHYKYKKEKPDTFIDFLKMQWQAQGRDMSGKDFYTNPIHLWNEKNRSYLKLKKELPDQTLTLTYEAVLEDYESELKKVFIFLKMNQQKSFENFFQSTKSDAKSHSFYQDYYLNENWRTELSDTEIAYINQHLDKDVVEAFNYTLL